MSDKGQELLAEVGLQPAESGKISVGLVEALQQRDHEASDPTLVAPTRLGGEHVSLFLGAHSRVSCYLTPLFPTFEVSSYIKQSSPITASRESRDITKSHPWNLASSTHMDAGHTFSWDDDDDLLCRNGNEMSVRKPSSSGSLAVSASFVLKRDCSAEQAASTLSPSSCVWVVIQWYSETSQRMVLFLNPHTSNVKLSPRAKKSHHYKVSHQVSDLG